MIVFCNVMHKENKNKKHNKNYLFGHLAAFCSLSSILPHLLTLQLYSIGEEILPEHLLMPEELCIFLFLLHVLHYLLNYDR